MARPRGTSIGSVWGQSSSAGERGRRRLVEQRSAYHEIRGGLGQREEIIAMMMMIEGVIVTIIKIVFAMILRIRR